MPAYKYKLKDGKTKWYANFYYTDWTGNKKHICKRGFATQRDAKRWEKDFLDQQMESPDIPFKALYMAYIDDLRHRLKPTTINSKEFMFKSRILPYFENLKLSEITSVTVRKWQNELLSHTDLDGRHYSQTYIKTLNNQLSAIMNYAMRHYGLINNPCKAAGAVGRSSAGEMQIWTVDQYESFRSACPKLVYRVAFDILFYTGIRSGELLALTPADIFPDHISITKNFAVLDGQELILEPKTDRSIRDVTIPEFLYVEITEYLDKLYRFEKDDRIFYFKKYGLRKEMNRIINATGLPAIRIHDLRHSHASMLIHMGINITEISARLGHESIKTTLDTYAHLYPGAGSASALAIEKINPNKKS